MRFNSVQILTSTSKIFVHVMQSRKKITISGEQIFSMFLYNLNVSHCNMIHIMKTERNSEEFSKPLRRRETLCFEYLAHPHNRQVKQSLFDLV